MWLNNICLLAANTTRSQAYIQTLVAHDLYPSQVILLGNKNTAQISTESKSHYWKNILLPDLNESILDTCSKAKIPVSHCDTNDVNSPLTISAISQAKAEIVIYSGFGGQIVSENVLNLGSQFLHMHSGWLPEYRGSTTLYYALLNGESPAVTALILDRTIDTGPVIAKKYYPIPPANIDIDLTYDAAIRADLLVRVIKTYVSARVLPNIKEQSNGNANTYYVIHPVLKHLAILSLEN